MVEKTEDRRKKHWAEGMAHSVKRKNRNMILDFGMRILD